MTFSERVLALTQDWLIPNVADNTLGGNIILFRVVGSAKEGKGSDIKKAIKYQKSGTAASFAGLDTFIAALLTTKVRLSFDMRGFRIPIALSGMEVVANNVNDTQITNMVTEALDESQQELLDAMGDIIYGNGTGNSSKDPLGIGAAADDATDVATYGTLARSTYPVLNATRTASGGQVTLNKLATLYSAISSGTSLSTPTLLSSNETVWDLYETLLTPMVRENYTSFGYYSVGKTGGAVRQGSNEGLVGTQGFVAVTYKGIPWVRDEKSTAQTVWMLNENWLTWYGWDARGAAGYNKVNLGSSTVEGLYKESPMSEFHGINWSGFRTPTGQFAEIADVIVLGNLVSFQPRRQGRLTGVTSA